LYLPSPLLQLYLQCMANFHKLYFSHMSLPSCEFVGARSPCFKRRVSGSNFCRRHSRWGAGLPLSAAPLRVRATALSRRASLMESFTWHAVVLYTGSAVLVCESVSYR
jgi:hypothetical protein